MYKCNNEYANQSMHILRNYMYANDGLGNI